MWVPVIISSSPSCALILRNETFFLELSSSHPKTFVMLPVSSDSTSSPILRSFISFCLPDPVVTRVSRPKHAPVASAIADGSVASEHNTPSSPLIHKHPIRLCCCGCCCINVLLRQIIFQETPGPCLSVHLPVCRLRKGPLLVPCVSLPLLRGGNNGTAPKQILKQYFQGWLEGVLPIREKRHVDNNKMSFILTDLTDTVV